MYGYIAHHTHGFWFKGPLPSPGCARRLVQMYQGIALDALTSVERLALQRKWECLAGQPDNLAQVKWVIELEAAVPTPVAKPVSETLGVLRRAEIPIYRDAGPLFGETRGDGWTGESCHE